MRFARRLCSGQSLALSSFLCILLAAPTLAQSTRPTPPKPTPPRKTVAPVSSEELVSSSDITKREVAIQVVEKLVKQSAELEQADPQKAIALYKRFWEEQKTLHPAGGVRLTSAVATVYKDRAKDANGAAQVAIWGLSEYKDSPDRILLVADLMTALVAQTKTDVAEQVFKENLGLILRSGEFGDAVRRTLAQYEAALTQLLRKKELPDALQRGVTECPGILDDAPWNAGTIFYDTLLEKLIEQQRTAEARQWAKLRFQLCSFDQAYLDRATRSLVRVWGAKDSSLSPVRKFGEIQRPAEVRLPSGLDEVPTPKILDKKQEEAFLMASDGTASWQRHDRVTLHLLNGQFAAGMRVAEQWLKQEPKSADAVREICRVFKAADLKLDRANAFLAFHKGQNKENPIAGFYRDHPSD